MPHEIFKYRLPAYWASYLINNDASGLEPGEREQIDAWLEKQDLPKPVDVGEAHFSWSNDATDLGGDTATYTFLIPAPALQSHELSARQFSFSK